MAAQRAANASLLTTMRQVKDLSPSERHIVEYIFNNLQSVTNMGIIEMGERTFTSSTTVKRLCRKLGIESYTDFRLRLSAEIASYSHMNILQGAQSPVDRYDTINDIINKVSDQNAKSIIDTSTLNPPDVIMDVINLMKNATNIDFYGCGPSNVVAMDAQLKCMRLGISSTAYGERSCMLMNARAFRESTLAIIISYTGETEAVISVAKELVARNIATVALTSMADSTLCGICRYNLFVQASESWDRLGGMSSRISTLNLIDILFTALINTDHKKYTQIMQRTNVVNTGGPYE